MKTLVLHIFVAIHTLVPSLVHATVVVVGDQLEIGNTNSSAGGSGAFGYGNTVYSSSSLAVGTYNTIDTDEGEHSSLVVGQYNFTKATSALCVGSYNHVGSFFSITTGYLNYNNGDYSIMAGTGNVSGYNMLSNSIVTGTYNQSMLSKPAYLVIGNGTSSTNRKNSFVVYADGDIVIAKPQGDISMGIYE